MLYLVFFPLQAGVEAVRIGPTTWTYLTYTYARRAAAGFFIIGA